MSGRYLLDVRKSGRGWILVNIEKQKVGNCQFIQIVADIRMPPDAIQGVAEDEGLARAKIVEPPDPQMIASAKNPAKMSVPDSECKIAEQMLDALFSEGVVG